MEHIITIPSIDPDPNIKVIAFLCHIHLTALHDTNAKFAFLRYDQWTHGSRAVGTHAWFVCWHQRGNGSVFKPMAVYMNALFTACLN